MTQKPDNWVKPRSNGTHLTEAEIAEVRVAFASKQKIETVARRLQCASRTVSKYYGLFRAECVAQRKKRPVAQDRFYTSDFKPG